MAPPLSSPIHNFKVGDCLHVKTTEEKLRLFGAAARYRSRYGRPVDFHIVAVAGGWRITRIN